MEQIDQISTDMQVAEVAERLREVMALAQTIPHSDMLVYLIASAITEAEIDYRTRVPVTPADPLLDGEPV